MKGVRGNLETGERFDRKKKALKISQFKKSNFPFYPIIKKFNY